MGEITQDWIEASEAGAPILLTHSEISRACRWHLVDVEEYFSDMVVRGLDPSDAGHLATWLGY